MSCLCCIHKKYCYLAEKNEIGWCKKCAKCFDCGEILDSRIK